MYKHILFLSLRISFAYLQPSSSWYGCISHHEIKFITDQKTEIMSKVPLLLNMSLDLGISSTFILLNENGLCNQNSILLASWDELNEIVRKAEKGQPGCYCLYDDGCKPWRISCISGTTGNPAALCPPLLKSGAPTMVLGGFTMHRIAGEGMDPMVDTLGKIDCLNLAQGDRVLDTCMGLGYTAIEAARRVKSECLPGRVTTIEYDTASVDMASHNPWSKQLFDGSLPIDIIEGDACEVIKSFPAESFDAVVHDPPARALCRTDMFGSDFYSQLRRVLRRGGRLYHYIGNPKSKESGTLYAGTVSRLKQAGFAFSTDYKTAFGVVAVADGQGESADGAIATKLPKLVKRKFFK